MAFNRFLSLAMLTASLSLTACGSSDNNKGQNAGGPDNANYTNLNDPYSDKTLKSRQVRYVYVKSTNGSVRSSYLFLAIKPENFDANSIIDLTLEGSSLLGYNVVESKGVLDNSAIDSIMNDTTQDPDKVNEIKDELRNEFQGAIYIYLSGFSLNVLKAETVHAFTLTIGNGSEAVMSHDFIIDNRK